MTKIEGYKCDYCKKLHESEVLALTCEDNHIKVIKTHALYKENDTIPKEVILTFDNGESAYYEYAAHVYS